jgi:type III pantothenate kinase
LVGGTVNKKDSGMILVFDIGNTNIKTGLFANGKLKNSWRMSTNQMKTADELGIKVSSFFGYLNYGFEAVEGIIISSVIPSINYTMEHMCQEYFKKQPLLVTPEIKTGLKLCYDDARTLGADRICNAVAASKLYGGPCVTVDFGTATVFNVLSGNNEFLGGAICPGIKISIDALVERTSKLPSVEIEKPPAVIGTNTVHALQSGLLYGYVGQVDYIIRKIRNELKRQDARVVATGGMSNLIATESEVIREINPTLTLEGLNILYEMNV